MLLDKEERAASQPQRFVRQCPARPTRHVRMSWRRAGHALHRARIPNIVRRAKLGVVSRGKDPAPEALARHRVPRVASPAVTLAAKRTQGGDGRQCASVKGWSPVMDTQLWMPTWLCSRKAISREPSRPWLRRIHRGRRPWHVTKAAPGTREILWVLPGTGVGWHNRHTGRKPNDPEEVGCLHMSEEVG